MSAVPVLGYNQMKNLGVVINKYDAEFVVIVFVRLPILCVRDSDSMRLL